MSVWFDVIIIIIIIIIITIITITITITITIIIVIIIIIIIITVTIIKAIAIQICFKVTFKLALLLPQKSCPYFPFDSDTAAHFHTNPSSITIVSIIALYSAGKTTCS